MRKCCICGASESLEHMSLCDYCDRPACTFECLNAYEDEEGKPFDLCDECDEKQRAKDRLLGGGDG